MPFSVSSYSTRGGDSAKLRRIDDLLGLEPAQPLGERARADPGARVLDLGEAPWPLGELVDDQDRPLGADDLRAGSHRACLGLVNLEHRSCSHDPDHTVHPGR